MINKQSPKNLSAFLYTQFFVAFNDNMHYIAVAVYLAGLSKESASAWQAFVSAAFMAPFILFSPLAGSLADRFNKRSVLIISKWFEVVPMSVSLFASLALEPPLQYWGLVAGVFLMEVQSAFFSPAKYGILPEITEEQNLIKINGILEMLTIIAIILGQATGGILLGNTGLRITIAVCLLTAVVGSILSFRIPFGISGSKTSKIEIIPFINIHKTLGKMSADRRIIVLLFSLSLFWMVAAMFRMNLPVFGSHTLYLDETLTGIMISVMSLGIGAGSLIATSIRSHHMGLGVIFPAITGMSLSAILLYAVGYTYSTSTLILGVTGFFGGLYLVPQNAIFQSRSPKESRGSYIATLNLVSFSLMFVSSLIFWALTSLLGLNSSGVFLMIGLFLMVAGILLCLALPEIVTWAIVFTVTRLFYRIKSYGGKNIPAQGGVLLAPNHITLVDSFFLFSTCSRPLKFIIDKTWYDHPILHPLFKAINLIPMSQGMGSKGAINAAIEGLKNGSVIVVFPEGELSRIGNIQRFRSGIEHISKEANVPILPVHIDRLWGSMFSFRGGKFIKKLPQRFPYPVTVTYGKLLPPGSDSFKVRQEVIELSSFAFRSRLQDFKSLGNEFIKSAKQRLFRTA
ncbi:MAG: MFS transporter, partial [Planctomycetes bacterium]|nr:MFS transporter [Planctomycetota bacterium]